MRNKIVRLEFVSSVGNKVRLILKRDQAAHQIIKDMIQEGKISAQEGDVIYRIIGT